MAHRRLFEGGVSRAAMNPSRLRMTIAGIPAGIPVIVVASVLIAASEPEHACLFGNSCG